MSCHTRLITIFALKSLIVIEFYPLIRRNKVAQTFNPSVTSEGCFLIVECSVSIDFLMYISNVLAMCHRINVISFVEMTTVH